MILDCFLNNESSKRSLGRQIVMKLAFMVATPEIRSSLVTAYRGELEQCSSKIAELGYNGVEFLIRDPRKIKVDEVQDLLNRYQLELPMICTGEVYGEDRLSFMDPNESVREEALKRTREIIIFASHFNTQVNIGRLRGSFREGLDRKKSLGWALSAFEKVSEHAQKYGVGILLEPINRLQSNFINTTEEGIKMVEKVKRANFCLMLDLFHMNIEDVSIEESIFAAKRYLRHIHICDSNREVPGQGHLNFERIIGALKKIGYKGYLSAEIWPVADQDRVAKETIDYLRAVIG